jgi:hypothetical protein
MPMKHLIIACGLLILLTMAARPTFACFCGEIKNATIVSVAPPPTPDEIRKWRAEQTDYAVFTGRVIRIDSIHVKRLQSSNDKFPMKKVTVAVQNYWLGVKQTEMVIYTGVGHGDCGVPYRKGNLYLFVASRDPVTHFLETNICGPTDVEDKVVTYFDEIFGRAKSFS